MYWLFVEDKKITIKLSSLNFYTLFLTVVFLMPSVNSHSLFVVSWVFVFFIGALFGKVVYVKPLNLGIRKYIFIVLVLAFFITGIIKIKNFNILDIGVFHEFRRDLELSYFEYLFNRSLYIIPFLYIFWTVKSKLVRIFVTILAIVISFSSLQKAPVVFAVLSIVIYRIISKRYRLSLAKSFFVILLFLSLSVTVSMLMYNAPLGVTIEAVLSRIFIKPARYAYYAMEMIDGQDKFYYGGASFYTLFQILDLDRIRLGLENYFYIFGSYLGSANTPNFTGAYADFGFFGLFYSFIVGFIFRVFDNTIYKEIYKDDNKMLLSAYSCSAVLSLKVNVTVLGSALMGEGLAIAMIISYLSMNGSNVYKNKTNKSWRIS